MIRLVRMVLVVLLLQGVATKVVRFNRGIAEQIFTHSRYRLIQMKSTYSTCPFTPTIHHFWMFLLDTVETISCVLFLTLHFLNLALIR